MGIMGDISELATSTEHSNLTFTLKTEKTKTLNFPLGQSSKTVFKKSIYVYSQSSKSGVNIL